MNIAKLNNRFFFSFFVWFTGGFITWLLLTFLYSWVREPKLSVVFFWIPIFSAFWPVWIWFVAAIAEYFAKKAKI